MHGQQNIKTVNNVSSGFWSSSYKF